MEMETVLTRPFCRSLTGIKALNDWSGYALHVLDDYHGKKFLFGTVITGFIPGICCLRIVGEGVTAYPLPRKKIVFAIDELSE
ncbi:hypothetical protein TNCV_3857931 [Trichonephila clavipes]|nr:hypothetical protein TNCV_3857931 [Trichonephila clavipes]